MSAEVSRVDEGYDDPRLAALYDAECPWHAQDDFYLALDLAADSVLDVGCGTGSRLVRAREVGHAGRLVGVDPAVGMLQVARTKSDRVEWVYGDAQTVDLGARFGLVTMTGHAFQCLLGDADIRAALASFRRHLDTGGRFAFESRNPDHRGWESWTAAASRGRFESPDGAAYETWVDLQEVSGEFVRFRSVTRWLAEPAGRRSAPAGWQQEATSTLRFLPADHLRDAVQAAGFEIEGWYGDWDRAPVAAERPEIVVVARAV